MSSRGHPQELLEVKSSQSSKLCWQLYSADLECWFPAPLLCPPFLSTFNPWRIMWWDVSLNIINRCCWPGPVPAASYVSYVENIFRNSSICQVVTRLSGKRWTMKEEGIDNTLDYKYTVCSRVWNESYLKVPQDCTVTRKAPTRTFSWLKAPGFPGSAFTFKTLSRHYAKRTLGDQPIKWIFKK